jgi:signal transduction histidine kinase
MKSLWLRIYLALVATLLVFALTAGALVHRHWSREREQFRENFEERMQTMADLLAPALLPADASLAEQQSLLQRWSLQLRVPLALEDAAGRRIAASLRYERREAAGLAEEVVRHQFADGRRLLMLTPWRPGMRRGGEAERPNPLPPWLVGTGVPALIVLLLMLFLAVAFAAWPVARKLTKRLEALKTGVDRFGQGDLGQRVPEQGRDEVAALAHSFNHAAARIEQLVNSHRSLLANASHELRSPLARLRMALAIRDEGRVAAPLDAEIERNLRELDALVDEVLLASRLEAGAQSLSKLPVDVLALAAEMAAQLNIELGDSPASATLLADERLLRRALRNLLENARRYGVDGLQLQLLRRAQVLEFRVLDRGPGVPAELRERIFEPFFRLPGHAEMAGGVGLGLALVKQIAEAHGGRAWVEPRDGGGAVFVISLPG